LEIENFKSIRSLKLGCKRINLFIGEPNTGKTNILETIGLLSQVFYGNIRAFVRCENVADLFYDRVLDNSIKVAFDGKVLEVLSKGTTITGEYHIDRQQHSVFSYDYNFGGGSHMTMQDFSPFKFYRFAGRGVFPNRTPDFLHPPDGDNLLTILMSHKELKSLVRQIFERVGLMLVFEPSESRMKVQEQVEDMIVAYPYSLASDTLQRIVFHLASILSNRDSIITLEEPEAHAFPYYTKYLGETIALDRNQNQYFISTHNPYLLLSIVEKAPKSDVAIFNTYLENHQTKTKALTESQIEEVLGKGIDVFFDLERLIS